MTLERLKHENEPEYSVQQTDI